MYSKSLIRYNVLYSSNSWIVKLNNLMKQAIESGKAVFEVICPVSGTITAINEKLLEAPELINQNPYEKGWIAEIELSDFESDKDFLLDFNKYFEVLKRKVDEFHV